MKRFYLTLLSCLLTLGSLVAQNIPTGLVRIVNRRTTTAYLTSNAAGSAIAPISVSMTEEP